MLKNITLTLGEDNQKILELARALSSPQRLEILSLLNTTSMTVKEIADYLKYPLSSTLLNINILEACELIKVKETYTKLGKSKLCDRNCDAISFNIFKETLHVDHKITTVIPIGNYCSYDIPYGIGCGIATKEHTIGTDNDTNVFFHEERFKAGYIWFTEGFLSYKVINTSLPSKLSRISLSFEVCSEAPFYRNDWKSDITVFICDQEIGTWTSLGDYGGRRGKNNPRWWSDALTQFGVLTNWEITKDGTYVNGNKISNVTIKNINIKEKPYVPIKIGVKKDAKYCGGMSLFGKSFGDYDQDIVLTFHWD